MSNRPSFLPISATSAQCPPSAQGRPMAFLACNRCRKNLSSTSFVCSCDCVFCEDCAIEHFQQNSKCPNCKRELGTNDFTELVVSGPTQATNESLKNTLQYLFTKLSDKNAGLSYNEACHRLLKSLDDDRRAVKFLLRQFVLDATSRGHVSGNLGRAYEKLQTEYTQLKQSSSSKRFELEQQIADLEHRVQGLKQKLEERDSHNQHLHEILAAKGTGRVPSAGSHSSGGKRGRPHSGPGSSDYNVLMMMPSSGEHAMLEDQHHRDQGQRIIEIPRHAHYAVPVRGSSLTDEPFVTPIQVAVPSSSRAPHGHGTTHRDHHDSHHPAYRVSNTSMIQPGTPRIRNLSNNGTYVFATVPNGSHVALGGDDSKRRRISNAISIPSSRAGHSPTTAFAYNHRQAQHSNPTSFRTYTR